jgi:hypothetical protein
LDQLSSGVDIAQHLQGLTTERPTTITSWLNWSNAWVAVSNRSYLVFWRHDLSCHSALDGNDVLEEVDCRPSDALALAIALALYLCRCRVAEKKVATVPPLSTRFMGNSHPLEFKEAA